MEGLVVLCCSGSKKGPSTHPNGTMERTRKHAEERVQWMGGKTVDHYSDNVTHVLASTVNDDVLRARSDRKRVLKYGWVSDCWTKTLSSSAGIDQVSYKAHKLDLLAGCYIFLDPDYWNDKGNVTRSQFRDLAEVR